MGFSESAPVSLCQLMVNEAGSCARISTEMTQPGSLDVLARHLTRLRPAYSQDAQHHISNLIQQCGNFEQNPEGLRAKMLATMERIEGERG
jgi:hypothetical protein